MDSLLTSAAHFLSIGDPLGALKRIALREDAPALALRGIAMAQLGDFARARTLLRRAGRRFGAHEPVAQARCQVAEAEVALASRALAGVTRQLQDATRVLRAHGDRANAAHAGLVAARFHLLVGEIDAAETSLGAMDATLSPRLVARAELTRAELAVRRIRAAEAETALQRAEAAAEATGIPALMAEVARARQALVTPAARRIQGGRGELVRLAEVEAVLEAGTLVVDDCRREIRRGRRSVSLAGRPVLSRLVRILAEAWPAEVGRDELIGRVFGARRVQASHRAGLRVEISRLRAIASALLRVEATPRGFRLVPRAKTEVVVLAPPVEGQVGAILASLADGEGWSTSALARAVGASQRSIQRALRELEPAGQVRATGEGRSRRWLAPTLTGFVTTLLLPRSLRVG